MYQAKGHYLAILIVVLIDIASPTILRRNGGGRVNSREQYNQVAIARAGSGHSTSSESSDPESTKHGDQSGGKTSLSISSSSESTTQDSHNKPGHPHHDPLVKGWRKWHRKCTPCPEDRKLKWRDPRIAWICGGYQRARRSFKSECSMFLRNCQDGTMFTKIADHKCMDDETLEANDTTLLPPHGRHFFYDYKIHLSGDRSSLYSENTGTSSGDTTSSD